jgi:membrane-bound lytic murein transglycosylase D
MMAEVSTTRLLKSALVAFVMSSGVACAPTSTFIGKSSEQETAAVDSLFHLDAALEGELEDSLLRARWHLFRALDERTVNHHDLARVELDAAYHHLDLLDDNPYLDLSGDPEWADEFAPYVAEIDQLGDAIEQAYLSLLPHLEQASPDSPLSLLLKGLSAEEIENLPADASQIVRIHQLAALCDIPIDANAEVAASIHFFQTKGLETYRVWTERSGRYRDLILPILKEEGLPLDLFYLAMIESGFKPHAYSRARAMGMWQFIRQTGIREGLQVNHVVDERKNPLKATQAAARHLKSLYREFGEWRLAMAAYNAGQGRVRRAIAKAGTRDFWKLELPRETRKYVPLLMAATIIAKDPESFGIGPVKLQTPLAYDSVELPAYVDKRPFSVDLEAAAKMMGVAFTELKHLNMELRLGFTPPNRRGKYELLVPSGKGVNFVRRYAQLPESQKKKPHHYTVRRGDSISLIAQTYSVSPRLIAQVNDLRNPNLIRPGQGLFIPVQGSRSVRTLTGPKGERRYTVRRGDSLSRIARLFTVKVSDLKQWNNLDGDLIRPGQQLSVHLTAENTVLVPEKRSLTTGGRRAAHTVLPGESLSTIGRHFEVAVADLQSWNQLNTTIIHPGQKLLVSQSPFEEYKVVKGDTLYGIARRFGLDARAIARHNNMSLSSTLLAGMTLQIKAGDLD